MSTSKPKAPKAPDYEKLVGQQATYNMTNTITPWGSTSWSVAGQPSGGGVRTGQPVGGGVRTGQPVGAPVSIFSAQGSENGNKSSGFPLWLGKNARDNPAGTGLVSAMDRGAPMMQAAAKNMPADAIQGGPGTFTQQTQFSPAIQAIFDKTLATAGSNNFKPTVNMREVGDYGGAEYQALEDALYERAMSPVNQQFEMQNRAFEQSMADRGMPVGSEAYADQFNLIQDAQKRARNDAALAAVMGSRQAFEADRAFTTGLNETDRAWALQNAGLGINQQQANYGQLAALLGGLQQPQQVPIDVLGASGLSTNAKNNAYNQQMGAYNGTWGGMMGLGGALGGAAILASDASLKADIAKIGEVGGLNFYRWSWKPEAAGLDNLAAPYGFIAQEVQQVYPQHVTTRNGYLAIDYAGLLNEIGVAA